MIVVSHHENTILYNFGVSPQRDSHQMAAYKVS